MSEYLTSPEQWDKIVTLSGRIGGASFIIEKLVEEIERNEPVALSGQSILKLAKKWIKEYRK